MIPPAPTLRLCENAAEWHGVLAAMPHCALQQAWAYGELMRALGRGVRRCLWVDDAQNVLAAAQIVTRRFGPLRVSFSLRGPVFSATTTPEQQRSIITQITKIHSRWRLHFLLLMPELPNDASHHSMLEKAGLRRVMTGPATALWDLTPSIETLHQNLKDTWRNKIRRAELSKMEIKITRSGPLLQWLLAREQQQMRDKGYEALPPALIAALVEKFMHPHDVWVITALQGKDPIAGQLWLRHGNTATYYVGVTTPQGREANAHNALMWQAAETLKAAGVVVADLGGVDSVTAPGIARFKIETGAAALRLLGSYH